VAEQEAMQVSNPRVEWQDGGGPCEPGGLESEIVDNEGRGWRRRELSNELVNQLIYYRGAVEAGEGRDERGRTKWDD
jgi:hypothetical protein